jgi:hypothetical protein
VGYGVDMSERDTCVCSHADGADANREAKDAGLTREWKIVVL